MQEQRSLCALFLGRFHSPKLNSTMTKPSLETAGPFLKFTNCTPEDGWSGSVMYMTKLDGVTPILTVKDGSSSKSDKGPRLLDTELGWNFWRFDIKVQLSDVEREIEYEVKAGDVVSTASFWVQAEGKPFHFGYTSCNGISGSIAEDHYSRKDPTYLWRDMLQVHESFPLHCLIGGGDQVYSDPIWKLDLFSEWGDLPHMEDKIRASWTEEHHKAATEFYLNNYLESYMMEHVCTAYASIPSVMIWDDHDIWDGFGSYSKKLQDCEFFQGLFKVAKRFYLLFQLQATEEFARECGEFLEEAEGFHSVKFMGPQVALLGIDMRTKRSKKKILPDTTYDLLEKAMLGLPETVDHVVVLSGVPVVFPSILMSESILMGMLALFKRSAFLRRCGKAAGILDRFDQPEILDDLLDGWAASVHRDEKNKFIQMLQRAAQKKQYRVSILSGDAHVGGIGEIYSRARPRPSKEKDPLFMYQVISSAIMNSPPPDGVVSTLTRTNFAKVIDHKSKQKMMKAFGRFHNPTEKLLAQRNWCDISVHSPPYAPPSNPKDPYFGGLRFSLRAEDPDEKKGYAEDVYNIVTPRFPKN